MNPHALLTALHSALDTLRRSPSVESVARALGYALASRALLTDSYDEAALETTLRLARRTLLATGASGDEDGAIAFASVRSGYDLLARIGSEPHASKPAPKAVVHPTPRALVRLGRAELDAFEALDVASHVVRCDDCVSACQVSGVAEAPSAAPLRVAAKSSSGVRSPGDGTLLWSCDGGELVRFDDAEGVRLALYADAEVANVISPAVSLEGRAPGYWIGVLAAGVERLELDLELGEARHHVTVNVPHVD